MRHAFAFLTALLLSAPALAQEKDLVDTAASAGPFNTLVTAVKAAGLVDTLKSPGPFTVFAPTDEAFAKLPPGTLENLLKPENKSQLAAILTYHVVPGRVMAADVLKLNGQSVKTVQGSLAPIQVQGGTVKVGNANVVQTDIATTNGVIHVIDTVLLPPPSQAAAPAPAATYSYVYVQPINATPVYPLRAYHVPARRMGWFRRPRCGR